MIVKLFSAVGLDWQNSDFVADVSLSDSKKPVRTLQRTELETLVKSTAWSVR